MAKYGAFKYSEEKYGTGAQSTNLRWTFIVAWDGYWSHGNEAEKMIDLTVRRGRQWILAEGGLAPYGVGEAIAVLDNADGRYDPWNTDSPLYPNVTPGKFVRIAVLDHENDTNYGIMRGKIDDITLVKRGGNQEVARIKIMDGLSWLASKTINAGLNTTIAKSLVPIRILAPIAADWPANEWPRDISTDTDEMAYWWAWNQNAYKALTEFNQAECAVAFHNRDGEFSWRPRDYAHERTQAIDQAVLLADIGRPNPWEVVRNAIRITASPKVLDSINDIVWQLQTVPAIADGETFYIEPIFKWEEWSNICGSSITFDFTVNAEEGGGGADLSDDCTLTYDTQIGEGARLWLTNHSGTDGYITLLKATGDALYAPSIDIREAADTDSQTNYGPKTLEIKSRWVEDTEYAQTLATWLLSEFKDPLPYPVIQVEHRPSYQYYLDLYDRVQLTAATLGIDDNFRVGAIEHQWLSPNGQAVRTTFWLEPYMQQT